MFVALDIATRCGWAAWTVGWEKPIYGTWTLAGDAGEVGRKGVELHRKLADLHQMEAIDRLYFEGGIPTNGGIAAKTNMTTIYLLAGLAAHAESFAYAVNARCRNVPQTSWRKHFVGRGIRPKGVPYKDFKALSTARCHELGWFPADDNAADACAILDYAIHLSGTPTPWQDKSVFRGAIDG